MYPLKQINQSLNSMCDNLRAGTVGISFPEMASQVGRETDILIGIKHAKYFPEIVYMFASGLSVHRSAFLSLDSSDGIYGGPHPEFAKAEKKHGGVHAGKRVYMGYVFPTTEQYRLRSSLESEVPLLGFEDSVLCDSEVVLPCEPVSCHTCCHVSRKPLTCIKVFDEVGNACSEISYRCVDRRSSPECKKSPRLDSVSIHEEVDQSLID